LEFATCCLDFLVDMFNDEIEAVRSVYYCYDNIVLLILPSGYTP